MTTKPVILWFRRDLRLADNPALTHAADTGAPILPVYVLDQGPHTRAMGAASLWWLDKSLRALDASLKERGGRLILRRGDSESELRRLIEETGADRLYMNRLWEPDAAARDADVAHALQAEGVEVKGWNGTHLCSPGTLKSGTGGPYKVFTPFSKALLAHAAPPPHTLGPRSIDVPRDVASDAIDDWGLHPTRPDWSTGFEGEPGEAGASKTLDRFVSRRLSDYADGRDRPGEAAASGLSAHLHFGEISPWRAVAAAEKAGPPTQAAKFTTELIWRDFSAHLLHAFPQIVDHAFRPEYDRMPWRTDVEALHAWQRGLTGYPLVDAGMRELWTSGRMHNRVRMITASFLVKHLMIDWREGERWFWDCLIDADLANNVQNWQWVAGSGADASPYFRIFNPIAQGRKFDADGRYVRRWIPELARLPDKWLHAPWEAPATISSDAGVRLGTDYPHPIVEHEVARRRALDALKAVSASRVHRED